MLNRIARLTTGHPRSVLAVALLIAALCVAFGATVASHLESGGFVSSDMESARAERYFANHFPGTDPDVVVTVSSPAGADSSTALRVAATVVNHLRRHPGITGVQSYATAPPTIAQALRSKDGRTGLVLASTDGNDSTGERLAGALATELPALGNKSVTIRIGGEFGAYHEINARVTHELISAETIAVPLTLVVLILVFGSIVAACLPVAIGLFAIVATLGVLRLLTLVTDVSSYALNMTTALGLGLAIDYSLFIVSRYREELSNGLDHRAAVARSILTAGRTVVFSAVTVGLALSALLLFPQYFLRSFAYAGLAVMVTAGSAAVIILPACLTLLGEWVNKGDLRRLIRRLIGRTPHVVAPADSRWYRMVIVMMRFSIPVALVAVAVLLLVGSPFLSAQFGYPDDRVLPPTAQSRQVGDMLRTQFALQSEDDIVDVLPGFHGSTDQLGTYTAALSRVAHVRAVLSGAGLYSGGYAVGGALPAMVNSSGAYLNIITTVSPYSSTATRQLAALRAVPAPGTALFGGTIALNRDSMRLIGSRLPGVALIVAATTLILLFVFTGSVVLPVKALILNVLSLSATYGAMVWVFQDGHLAGLLGFTPTGYIDANMAVLMFCLAFGLSMDYEVFLLSRIREEWLLGNRAPTTNTHAVAMGVARTGRLFTAAAFLVAIIFVTIAATSQVSFMQLFGVGLALAVLSDATLIRMALVPALMRLMGRANWWAPRPLAALHRRIELSEEPIEVSSP